MPVKKWTHETAAYLRQVADRIEAGAYASVATLRQTPTRPIQVSKSGYQDHEHTGEEYIKIELYNLPRDGKPQIKGIDELIENAQSKERG